MTTNTLVDIDDTAWTDLHAAASASTGDPLTIQVVGATSDSVVFLDAVGDPGGGVLANDGGGVRTGPEFSTVTATPDQTESTWARTISGANRVSVQS
jgi:hypothetical protein